MKTKPSRLIDGHVIPTISIANPNILTIAHRGDWSNAPENSTAAIRAAIDRGVEIVELDVQATADGALILMHDETINRTTTGSGAVADLTIDQVRRSRLKNRDGSGEPIINAQVPTLHEALEEARGHIIVNVDTKFERDLGAVTRTILDLGMADQVLLKSSIKTDADIAAIKAMPFFGKIPYMPYVRARQGAFPSQIRELATLGPQMIEAKFFDIADVLDGRDILNDLGLRLWVNTLDVSHSLDFNDARARVDPDGVWGTLVDAGARAIQTDAIEEFQNWLEIVVWK